MRFIVGDNVAKAAAQGAALIAEWSREAIAERGRFDVALAGGESPKPLYEALRTRKDIEWRRWEVFFGDERAVSSHDPRSNLLGAEESLLNRVGVRPEVITSGPLKDQPSPLRPLTPEGRAALDAVVRDLYAQFVGMVAEGRGLPEPRVRELADGRIYTGRQALQLGLIDQIGGEAEARRWLADTKGVPAELRARDIDTRGPAERALSMGVEQAWRGGIDALRAAGLFGVQVR